MFRLPLQSSVLLYKLYDVNYRSYSQSNMKDPFMSECLLYYLKVNDVTYVGTADLPADIVLCGKGIYPRHAVFEYITKDNRDEGILGGTSFIVKTPTKVISHKLSCDGEIT